MATSNIKLNLGVSGQKFITSEYNENFETLDRHSVPQITATRSGTAYTASLADFKLESGIKLLCRFSHANTAANSLNVNATGARSLYINGSAAAEGAIIANSTLLIVYNGTQWVVCGGGRLLDGETKMTTPDSTEGGKTRLGYKSLYSSGSGSGSFIANVGIGYAAGYGITGDYNVAIGKRAVGGLKDISSSAAYASGSHNTGVGTNSQLSLTSGGYNSSLGSGSLWENKSGHYNTAIGGNTLYKCTNSYNTAVGFGALQQQESSTYNVALGYLAGNNNYVGSYSTFIGVNAGNYQWGGSTIYSTWNYVTCLGYQAYVSNSHQVQLGGSGDSVYGSSSYNSRSDARDKADITDLTYNALDFINALQPRQYRLDKREDYITEEVLTVEQWRDSALTVEEQAEYSERITGIGENGVEEREYYRFIRNERDGSKKRSRLHNGFIAQEVKAAADKLGFDFGGFQDHSLNGGGDVMTLAYEEFIAPLIGAVKALTQEVNNLKSQKGV